MRRLVSILFLSLLLVQAIPVLHFFSSQKEIFYVYIDEEKPKETSDEKKYKKEFTSPVEAFTVSSDTKQTFFFIYGKRYTHPPLETVTPPPDVF